ncbi:hypothetical protein CO172_02890 [Candidatus Uhrbacteria bacterium CG_4_9_14_3_um_filter_36_7]|uniref:Uncharacterized protein n=1 Tax=Candidatus Uhrbacteria bacterium CG_4_9_14_3_um_filter_36_7 TaxID=1975033 RepID=A0A2M7XGZ5_9BACT|nr:MAG: hypothetical protein CO172_02890 [Candidatus Uhrbacteria bacterium CG_4_9_14_3_um_filter_36_7]
MDYKKFYKKRFFAHVFSFPFIWAPLIPLLFLDLLLEIYHQIGFRLYGLPLVKRKMFIQINDRNKLNYLNFFEKIGCMYCGYVNGFFLYAKEVAGRTEKYWCGIMHEKKPGFKTHMDQIDQDFAEFGNEADFKNKYLQD